MLSVPNTSNSLSVSYGNRNLRPELQHNLFAHWIIFDQFSFTSVFTNLNVSYTKDKINWARTINDDLSQRLDLVNVDDDFRASGRIDFSTPIRPLGINFKTGFSESWNKGINLVNGIENINTNWSHKLRRRV